MSKFDKVFAVVVLVLGIVVAASLDRCSLLNAQEFGSGLGAETGARGG